MALAKKLGPFFFTSAPHVEGGSYGNAGPARANGLCNAEMP